MGFKVIRTTGLFFLVIGAIFWLQQPNLNSIGKNHKNYSSLIAFADENAEVTIAEMTLGSEEAEVHIVEYASYTCPHCATFHLEDTEILRALVEWFKTNASNDEIKSTPSFVINGEKFSNMGYDEFSSIIESKISQ